MRASIGLAFVVALAAGCWRDAPGSHATVATVPDEPPPAFHFTSAKDALDLPPAQKDVQGTARTARLAAAVVLPDGTPVYCLGVTWPPDVEGTPVTARGLLQATAEFAAGPGEAGTDGAVWVLRDCTFTAP
jgi:hypothetical protein